MIEVERYPSAPSPGKIGRKERESQEELRRTCIPELRRWECSGGEWGPGRSHQRPLAKSLGVAPRVDSWIALW